MVLEATVRFLKVEAWDPDSEVPRAAAGREEERGLVVADGRRDDKRPGCAVPGVELVGKGRGEAR